MQKSPEYDPVRLRHMLDAANWAQRFVAGHNRASLDTNKLLAFGVARALEIVGEAAGQITDELKAAHPQIPWSDITAMRNRLARAYFKVNLDVVWDSVTEDIPQLIAELEKILAGMDAD